VLAVVGIVLGVAALLVVLVLFLVWRLKIYPKTKTDQGMYTYRE
jgi:hypothetical protein